VGSNPTPATARRFSINHQQGGDPVPVSKKLQKSVLPVIGILSIAHALRTWWRTGWWS
jgi:hypothetical protein